MKIQVFKKSLEFKYFNTFFSKATFFVTLLTIISIVLPFILAYFSKGFWIKRSTFYEQPGVKYKFQYIFKAETNSYSRPIFCSNMFNIESKYKLEDFDLCSHIKVKELDYDEDNKNDELHFALSVINLQDVKITGITLILPLNYKLYTECYIEMEAYAVLQEFHAVPGVKLTIRGDLLLSQSAPVPCSKYKIFDGYNNSAINTKSQDLNTLFTDDYFTRNITTMVQNIYSIWQTGVGSQFELNVHLHFPEHKIYHIPKFWQVMKYAWIQYLALYILISWFINRLKDYMFENKFVSFYTDTSMYDKIKKDL